MENKLQQLTQKLYDEGLEKGRAEAERLVSEAKSEAAKIIADAKAEAEAIVKAAEAKAEDTAKNSMTEIALAGKQAVARIKEEISSLIAAESTFSAVKAANLDPEFVKAMLLSVARNWNGASSSNCKRCCPKPSGRSSTLRSPLRPRSCSKRASKWVIRRRYAPASRWAPRAAAITSPSRTTISRHC